MGCDYFLLGPDEGFEPPELLELPEDEEDEEDDDEDLLSEELDLVSLDLPPPSVFPPPSVLPELLFL